MVQEEEPEFEAPPVQEVATKPVRVRTEMTKKSSATPRVKLSVTNISDINPPDLALNIPVINERVGQTGFGKGNGLGIQAGASMERMALKIDDFGTTSKLDYAWRGTVYLFDHISRLRTDGDWFEETQDKDRQGKKIYNYAFNIPNQDFTKGFPGVSKQFEWFAIDFEAEINWPRQLAGEYEFRLTSDDGSILIVDRKDVIDNDGMHAMESKEGRVHLNAGIRKFRLVYFQGPATRVGLILEFRRVGESQWRIFDLQEYLRYQA
ncbi:PA14 domain-containing protein [Rubellicoccus peritrichatus]|uniref:PA14 domain-containing protein n=1 Tax=Rubellicoccus peritrichatus TaxID=3080537 RepID=A0AAQ3LCE3_9BACT|nr:PA14 domain-containing protein [Puniceicoccus sp. CR14]WOO41857.1 PA14 domain-containing protein [Puniceicoccus sp. CR14]